MKRLIAVTALLVLAGNAAHAQTKVAVYATGKFGTDKYEQLSFGVKNGKRDAIYYAYGKELKEVKLTYLSKISVNAKLSFKIQFSNRSVLSVVPGGTVLSVSDAVQKAPKIYAWKYVGPINGIGTFCEACAEDEKEAMQLIQAYYLK